MPLFGYNTQMSYAFHPDRSLPVELNAVFVFGSNTPWGRHGMGAAKLALQQFGARYGRGIGFVGRSYAIPTKTSETKTSPLTVLPLSFIAEHVRDFVDFAREHPELSFFVTRIGCGLAGYADAEMAPLFRGAPTNCDFPEEWRAWVGSGDDPL